MTAKLNTNGLKAADTALALYARIKEALESGPERVGSMETCSEVAATLAAGIMASRNPDAMPLLEREGD